MPLGFSDSKVSFNYLFFFFLAIKYFSEEMLNKSLLTCITLLSFNDPEVIQNLHFSSCSAQN